MRRVDLWRCGSDCAPLSKRGGVPVAGAVVVMVGYTGVQHHAHIIFLLENFYFFSAGWGWGASVGVPCRGAVCRVAGSFFWVGVPRGGGGARGARARTRKELHVLRAPAPGLSLFCTRL